MFSLRKITYILLFLMLFSPLLSYINVAILGIPTSTLFFKALVIVYFPFFWSFNKNTKVDKLLYFLLFYIIYIVAWSFFDDSLVRFGLMKFVAQHIQIATLFIIIIIYNTHFSDKFIRNAIFIFKVTVILAVIASVIQVFDNSFLAFNYRNKLDVSAILNLDIYQFRRASIFGFVDPNEVGLSFLPLLAVLIGFLLVNKKKSYLPFLLMGGIVAVLTNGRYIMVGFVIITFEILIENKAKLSNVFKFLVLSFAFFFILYLSLVYFGFNIHEWISERLFAEGDIRNSTRYGAFINFALFFPESPLWGVGQHLTFAMEEASRAIGSSQIHVGYLAHILSWGIVGSFFLFSFWFFLAKKLYRTAKQTKYWGSFFAFLIYFWAQATLVNYFIFFYGLIFALVFDKYYQDKYKLEMKNLKNKINYAK